MKKMTVKEFRKNLKDMKEYTETLSIGDDVIMKTTSGYAVRGKEDYDDPMTDYNAYVYGFKVKWLVERYLNDGLLIKES